MNEAKKRVVLNGIGVVFLFFGVLSVINSVFILQNYGQLVWVCNISLFILGYALLRRNSYLLVGQLCILLIPVLYWNVDFFYVLLFKGSLWGISNYFFEWGGLQDFGRLVTLYHLFSLPLSLYALYLMKRESVHEWVFSVIQITVLFVLAKLFTNSDHNINCVYDACVPISLGLSHEATWFILYIVMIGVTYIFLHNLPFLQKRKKRGTKA